MIRIEECYALFNWIYEGGTGLECLYHQQASLKHICEGPKKRIHSQAGISVQPNSIIILCLWLLSIQSCLMAVYAFSDEAVNHLLNH